MEIYLVRHGQDLDNANGILNGHRDQDLTPLGIQQTDSAADLLIGRNIDVICSSPSLRARHTAQIIADKLNLAEVETLPNLIERDFGTLTGKPITDIPKLAKKTFATDKILYFTEAEGAEDFPTLLVRAKDVLKYITEKYPNKNIVLVTHGDTGKMIQAAYYDWDWEKGLRAPFFANSEILPLKKDVY